MTRRAEILEDRIAIEWHARVRAKDESLSQPEPLTHFKDTRAWVLIADPGSGKSDAFQTLAKAESGYYITARNFAELGLPARWTEPIFIDGLDEITGGSVAGTTPLGQIRSRLHALGTPKFRISCREADWRGNTDGDALRYLVSEDNFMELHLVPLDDAQITALVMHWQQSDEAAALAFVQAAKDHDLEGLLDNPQTLRMLVKAVGTADKSWPDSKTQTYEIACGQLVREHNAEHLATQRQHALPDSKVLDAAGYLSAILLLSGNTAIALQRRSEPEPGVLALPELPSHASAPDLPYCQTALHTRLFRSNGSGDFRPVHRTVAEYLGARYLATRIQAGLPAKRVWALLLGEDAGVVPELRGLHAWLAATVMAGGTRAELIDHDPLGVVLHGDVRHFSREDKRHLLHALSAEATRYAYFRSQNWTSKPFGALASADMQNDFKALLQSPNRSPAHLALLDCVLDAMANGQPMPELIPDLERLARDKTYWPGMRTEALRIWIALTRQTNNWPPLMQLLADVHTNLVEDLEDELLGTLLSALYPGHIAPAELWQYFHQPKAKSLLGVYWIFWNDLPQKFAPPQDIPALLDSLVASGYRPEGRFSHLVPSSELVGKLLVHGVVNHGTQLEIERLSGWLSLGVDTEFGCALEQDEMASLAQWLSEHPETYKALYERYLRLPCEETVGGYGMLSRASAQLYHSPEPDDANLWYLALAKACESNDLRQALVHNAFHFVNRRSGPDAAIQLMEDWASHHVADADWVASQMHSPYPPSESQQRHVEAGIGRRNRLTEESLQKIRFFRETLPSFSVGPAHLGALEIVANTYLDFSQGSRGETPQARLFELLNHDAAWVESALTGLRYCLLRDDLPSATSIIDLLHSQGRGYKIATPCLAAMDLRYAEDPQSALDLPQSTLESVITFRLVNSFGNTPTWFTQLLAQKPGVFAAPMAYLIRKQLAEKIEQPDGLFALTTDAGYAHVATQIVPTLIAALPIKAAKSHLYSVRLLIGALLKRLDKKTQLATVAEKLNARAMDVAQHAYWLATGMLLAPELYLEPTRQFVAKAQARATHLFTLVHQLQERGNASPLLDTATQAFLIGTLGPLCIPDWITSGEGGWVKPKMEMGRYVEALISSLASSPDDLALQALTNLRAQPNMAQWEDTLTRALYDQRITRRGARFKPREVTQICDTLANTTPANAADLWALTLNHLTPLSSIIRNGNTNDYRQYWAGAQPKKEDDCRDTLLSDLKRLLEPLLISAEPEGRYADEKRADIKVSFLPYQIPIEIKRETHADLWKAIPNQLIAKYSREMSSDGYGIYLVFWFNGQFKAAPTDGGAKPVTPQELQQRLASTVPEHLRNKIAILVVDCSKQTQSVATVVTP